MIYAPIDVWVSFTPLSVSNGCRLAQGDTHKVGYLTHFVRWWCSGDESTLLVSILGVCWQEWMWKAGIFCFFIRTECLFFWGGDLCPDFLFERTFPIRAASHHITAVFIFYFLLVIFSRYWCTASPPLDLHTQLLWDLLRNCRSFTLDTKPSFQMDFQCVCFWSFDPRRARCLSGVSVETTPGRTLPLFPFLVSV